MKLWILMFLLIVCLNSNTNDTIVKNLNEEIEQTEKLITLYTEKIKLLKKLRNHYLVHNDSGIKGHSSSKTDSLLNHIIKKSTIQVSSLIILGNF